MSSSDSRKSFVLEVDSRPMILGMYPLAFAIFWVPMVDLIAGAIPVRLDNMAWRFGTFGLVMKSTLVPMLGLTVAAAIATFAQQRRVLRTLSVLGLLAALTLVAMSGIFVMDFIQMRGSLVPEARPGIERAVITALLIAGLQVPVAIGLFAGGWKASRKPPAARDGARAKRETGLIVTPPTPKESAS